MNTLDSLVVLLHNFQKFASTADTRVVALVVFLVFLLILLGWKVLESSVIQGRAFIYRLTPQGHLEWQQREAELQAEVDTIMAKIKSQPAMFMGPPKPPAWWRPWLKRLGYLAYWAFLSLWSWGAIHFYQQAVALDVRIRTEDAASLGGVSSMRIFQGDEPAKLYWLAAFLVVQVLFVLGGSVWEWHKTRVAQRLSAVPLP